MNDIMIELAPEVHKCLLDHVRKDSGAFEAINREVDIDGDFFSPPLQRIVFCDKNAAQILLETAKQYCPLAVDGIEEGIRFSRSRGA